VRITCTEKKKEAAQIMSDSSSLSQTEERSEERISMKVKLTYYWVTEMSLIY